MKKKFDFFKPITPPHHPGVSTKNFSPIGLAVWQAIRSTHHIYKCFKSEKVLSILDVRQQKIVVKGSKVGNATFEKFSPLIQIFSAIPISHNIVKILVFTKERSDAD